MTTVYPDRSLDLIGQAAPEPLRALTQRIIAPSNVAVLERADALHPLSWLERWQMRRKLAVLQTRLTAQSGLLRDIEAHLAWTEELEQQLIPLVVEQEDQPDDTRAQQIAQLERQLAVHKVVYVNLFEAKHAPLLALQQEIFALDQRFKEHALALKIQAAQKKVYANLQQEALWYRQLIVNRLTNLGFCFRWTDQNGNPHVKQVGLVDIQAGVDAIYYRVDAAYRNWRGNWDTNLPRGVRVEDLMSEKTALEIGLVTNRQVQTRFSVTTGAWYILNRHDSKDGILTYISYGEMMERLPRGRLVCPVGVGENRATEYFDLTEHTHGLIVGMSGTGKSNQINVIIGTLIQHPPHEVKLVLIDMKGNVEFGFYEFLPHLHGSICSDLGAVERRLQELEWLMSERQAKLRTAHCKNIDQYNAARVKAARWAHVFCIIDEAASLTSTLNKNIGLSIMGSLEELVRKGRAVGIHIIICTQRPDSRVLSGQVQNNIDYKIVFRMARGFDSITALGMSAAQEIADIKGRAIVRMGGQDLMLQTPHLPNDVLEKIIEQAKTFEAHDLPIPDDAIVLHRELTALEVAKTMVEQGGGNISGQSIHKLFSDEISLKQARSFSDELAKLAGKNGIEIAGVAYKLRRNGRTRVLVEAVRPEGTEDAD